MEVRSARARVEAHVFRTPIKEPVRTSFGTMTERAAVFVRVEDSDGARGWGEIWCNFPNAAAEHRALLFADIIAPRALGQSVDDPVALWNELERALHVLRIQSGDAGAFSAALAGLDLAVHDLRARKRGLPLWRVARRPGRFAGAGLCLGHQSRRGRLPHRRAHARRRPSRLQAQDRLRRGDRPRLAEPGCRLARQRRAADGRREPGLGPQGRLPRCCPGSPTSRLVWIEEPLDRRPPGFRMDAGRGVGPRAARRRRECARRRRIPGHDRVGALRLRPTRRRQMGRPLRLPAGREGRAGVRPHLLPALSRRRRSA